VGDGSSRDRPSDRPTDPPPTERVSGPLARSLSGPTPGTRDLRGATASQRGTLPAPEAVPRRLLDSDELGWLALDEEALRLAQLVDGVRTIRELAALRGAPLGMTQMLVMHLRERHVVTFA
jgi:hypothetical protein